MFNEVIKFFQTIESAEFSESGKLSSRELQISGAVILLETAFVDLDFPDSEQQAIVNTMASFCGLSDTDAQDLVDLSELVRIKKTRIAPFMAAINKHLNTAQKQMLYAAVWHVIKADSVVNRRELQAATALGKLLQLTVEEEIEARKVIIHDRFPVD